MVGCLFCKKLFFSAQARADHLARGCSEQPSVEKLAAVTDTKKDTNPKDAVGVLKVPFSTIPARVMAELGLALLEGARKYGRFNWRAVGVRATVYYDAAKRHLSDWYEGQDIDPDSGLSHITKAIACLTVLRDSMLMANWVDDRPPRYPDSATWVKDLNARAKEIVEKYPNAPAPFVHVPAAAGVHAPTVEILPSPRNNAPEPYCWYVADGTHCDCSNGCHSPGCTVVGTGGFGK